jgi:hypothetical protein
MNSERLFISLLGIEDAMSIYQLPIFTVPSTRELLNRYNTQIIELKSVGSRMQNNDLNSIDGYGYSGEEVIQTKVTIDYEKEWEGHNQPVNEITEREAYEICRELDVHLKKPNKNNIDVDIPVERVVIEVEDRMLQGDLASDTPHFFLEYVSVPVRDSSKDSFEKHFKKRNLLEQGFEFRVLALKSVSSEKRWFSKEPANLYWGGLEDVNLPYDSTVSSHIKTTHMDDEISEVKDLEKVTEEKFKL